MKDTKHTAYIMEMNVLKDLINRIRFTIQTCELYNIERRTVQKGARCRLSVIQRHTQSVYLRDSVF